MTRRPDNVVGDNGLGRWAGLLLLLAVSAPAAGQADVPPPPPVDEAAPPATPPADVPPPPPPVDLPLDRAAADDRAGLPPAARDTLRALAPPPVLDAYRADPDFQYDRPEAEGPSLWDRFWAWVYRTFWEPVARSTTDTFWQWTLAAFAVGVLGWVVTRLLRAEGSGVFGRSAGPSPGAPLLDVEDIARVDLGAALDQAVAGHDWRQAVRLRYLLALQALDAGGALVWRCDKTNREYGAEVAASAPDLARPFRDATRAFDAVWYGDRPVSDRLYRRLAPTFDRVTP